MHRLRSEGQLRISREQFRDGRQSRERRSNRDVDLGMLPRRVGEQRAHELARLRDRLVHLPVSGDQDAAHAASSAATPGSVLPSRNSSVAPPPVLTCVTPSAKPSMCAAAAASPPPTTVTAPLFVAATSASPIVCVPWRYAGFSYTPIGPLKTIVFAQRITSAYTPAVAGPMSRIMRLPSGSTSTTSALCAASRLSATIASVGSWNATFLCLARARMFFAGSRSGSRSDAPTSTPSAARNVLPIPPPTQNASTFSIRCMKTPILSAIFAPPIAHTYGCAGFSVSRESALSSASINKPAAEGRK